jgi:hypothetical protein
VALGGEVIDLVRLHFLDDTDQVGGVRQVAVVQAQARVFFVRVLVEVLDAPGVEGRRTPLHAMHHVALFEQQLGQVGAVLTGDAGDECDLTALAVGH